jgi:hypothetical protein
MCIAEQRATAVQFATTVHSEPNKNEKDYQPCTKMIRRFANFSADGDRLLADHLQVKTTENTRHKCIFSRCLELSRSFRRGKHA